MDNYDIDSIIERYKKEIIELNKIREKNIKIGNLQEEKNKRAENKKAEKNYTNNQKGAGQNSEADDMIAPLDREKNDKDGYTLENLNQKRKPYSKKYFSAGEKKKSYENTQKAKIMYEQYKNGLPEFGTLRVETVSSNMLYPVSNVHVVIYKNFGDENYFIYDTYTDGSGAVKDLKLPAPSKSLSQSPDNSDFKPYATYNIYVEHPYFFNVLYENVPIFDGIVSIQAVEMVPDLDGTLYEPTIVIEKEPSELGGA